MKAYAARRRLIYLGVALATVAAGLSVRFAPLGLPWVVTKYGGSALWAVMIYWLLRMVWMRHSPAALACVAGTIATLWSFRDSITARGWTPFVRA